MTSHLIKHSENSLPPVVPVLRSKARILSTVTNKDTRIVDVSLTNGKAALERQRENASKLASGRSVVSKADKENDVAFRKPVKIPLKLPQKPKKPLEQKKIGLQKSDSVISIYQQQISKTKEKTSTVAKAEVPVARLRKITVSKDEANVKAANSKTEEEKKEKEIKIEKKEEPKKEIKEEVKEELKEKKDVENEDDYEEAVPLGVNLIDVDDDLKNNEFILGLYAADIYNFLRHLEKAQAIRKNYLTAAHIMTQHMRAILVDWIFEVQQSFRLLNETVQLAIALLDRFMQDHPAIAKDELQLVAVACIFLASKYEEMFPPDLDDLVDISANTYAKHQILKMEQIIFSALDFQMGRPLPSQFLRRFGRAGNVDVVTYCFSKYFIDLSLVHYALCHVPPSLLAAASLYLSLYITADDLNTEIWTPTLIYYSKYSEEALKPVVSQIASIVLAAPSSKYQTVPKKYLDPKTLRNVSARSELKSERLMRIANGKSDL